MESYWLEFKISLAGLCAGLIGLVIAFKINEKFGVIVAFVGIIVSFHGILEGQKIVKMKLNQKYNKEHKKD